MILRGDGEEEGWWAWSPQCPGLTTGHETEAELLQSLPETVAWCFEGDNIDDDFEIQIHVEHPVGNDVFVRVARDEQQAARQQVADRIVAALTHPDLAERILEAPRNWADETICICALPTDTRSWLDLQMEEGDGVVIVVVPLSDSVLWARAYGDQPPSVPATDVPAGMGSPVRPATFAEATRTPDEQRILVPA